MEIESGVFLIRDFLANLRTEPSLSEAHKDYIEAFLSNNHPYRMAYIDLLKEIQIDMENKSNNYLIIQIDELLEKLVELDKGPKKYPYTLWLGTVLSSKLFRLGATSPLGFLCPGCNEIHYVYIDGNVVWSWNNDLDKPTFSPSVLTHSSNINRKGTGRCHSFVTDGMIQFLSDCEHDLVNQTVPLGDVEQFLIKRQMERN